ncbi:molybdopterin-guanine dinucleotide biosynthesis protein MobB [Desulfobaculum sp. SPO524]|uniref:molybdopterin-guanine dinucleotide biosynthesis protein MobB n=1 Tax=Desulfobaculum sp. SPO524 TaxID=3378071 RepID=UPI00385416CD
MIAISIVGYKDTGKTTLAVKLGEELRSRGIRAAAAKFSHHELDAPGTDTARLREAYGTCAGLWESGAILTWDGKRYLPDIAPLMDCEVLVVEGGKSLGWLPRVMLLRSIADAGTLDQGLAVATYGEVSVPGMTHLTDVAALADCVLEQGFALPGLDCGSCGREDCATLAREIVSGKVTENSCKARKNGMEVTVGGVPVGMNDFVRGIISGSILGMLRELKGVGGGDVEIRITK